MCPNGPSKAGRCAAAARVLLFDDARVAEALAVGFSLLPEFPEQRPLNQPYRSPYLFSTFRQRIPHPQRPDYAAIMAAWGIERQDDPFEVLARSGGIQLTDRLELAEHRATDDGLFRPLEFRIAGFRRHAGDRDLRIGDDIGFRREPENTYDPMAVIVLDRADRPVGYVPRHYSEPFANVLDSGGRVEGLVVRRLVVPESKWVVRARRGD
jgi:hypothetical protein